MKRAFVLSADGHLVSELVPGNTEAALNIGDRIAASRPLDLGYAAQIEEGECGTVAHVDHATGMTDIHMDKFHLGLAPWRNCIWLEPFGTEDILSGVVLIASAVGLLVRCA